MVDVEHALRAGTIFDPALSDPAQEIKLASLR